MTKRHHRLSITDYCNVTCIFIFIPILVLGLLFTSASFATVTNITSGGPLYSTMSNAVFLAGNGDTLLVTTGVYIETIDIYNRNLIIDGKYNNNFSAKVSGGKTVVSAPHGSFPLFWYSGSTFDITNSVLTLNDLDICDGGFSFSSNGSGGGMNIRYGSVVSLYNCMIYTNFCRGNGGGIYAYNSTLNMTNTYIYANNAFYATFALGDNGCGGGIAAYNSTINIESFNQIYFNTAEDKGGGLRIKASTASVHGTDIAANTADNGGGVSVHSSIFAYSDESILYKNMASTKGGAVHLESNSTGTISGAATFIGLELPYGPNSVTNGNGGGIYVQDSYLVISNYANVAYNSASGYGGGIFLTNSLFLIKNADIGTQFFDITNSAAMGGGIYAIYSSLTLTNSMVTRNYANSGGGMMLTTCSTEINDSKINENFATNGPAGGLFLYGSNIFNAFSSEFNYNKANNAGAVLAFLEIGNINFDSCSVVSNIAFESGAGIVSYLSSKVNISGMSIINFNKAQNFAGGLWAYFGGQIYLKGDSLSPISIQGNSATNGGGIAVDIFAEVHVEGNVLIGNNTAFQNGGGILITNQSQLVMTNISFFAPRVFANLAETGGGGGIFITGSNSYADLYDVSVGGEGIGNKSYAKYGSSKSGGGGILIDNSAVVDAINCSIEGNFSSNSGGGIYLGTNSVLNMTCDNKSSNKSMIYNNTCRNAGGGIYAKLANNVMIENTFVISNKTISAGAGGMYFGQSSNKLVNLVVVQNDCGFSSGADGIFFFMCPKSEMLECTVADNDRVGIMNNFAGSVYITNCIVYGHSLSQFWDNAEINVAYSDIQNGFPGTGNISSDPLFIDVANFNYMISIGSPCEDAGTDLTSVTNDIIGVLRPYGSGWDMGAFEAVPESGFYLLFIIGNMILLKIIFRT